MATLIAQFQSVDGSTQGPQLNLPTNITTDQLQQLINDLLENEEATPYNFYVNEEEVNGSLDSVLKEEVSTETLLKITYVPQAIFRVQPVTRCTSSLEGHAEAVLSVAFSPDGQGLASGSGDGTLRIWDIDTETPLFTCKGHSGWVLCVAWSPDSSKIATGSLDKEIRIWDAKTGKLIGRPLKGHKKWINGLAWEPFHKNPECTRLASASKDGLVRIWDTVRCVCLKTLAASTPNMAVTCVKWGGENLIYTASQDRTLKVWDSEGKLCRTLAGHGHWVNTMALSTEYALRTGPFDHTGARDPDPAKAREQAQARYDAARGAVGERLVSGSDDYTLFLWNPATDKKPLTRMTGHQNTVNQVAYSPDGRYFASASFDKSVKIWDHNGKFIATLRGHVGAVYQVAWSGDSRMVVSGSKDSTMKVWDPKTGKIKCDLPGHADEVYSVDWSPNGVKVASGSKDKVLKIWRA